MCVRRKKAQAISSREGDIGSRHAEIGENFKNMNIDFLMEVETLLIQMQLVPYQNIAFFIHYQPNIHDGNCQRGRIFFNSTCIFLKTNFLVGFP